MKYLSLNANPNLTKSYEPNGLKSTASNSSKNSELEATNNYRFIAASKIYNALLLNGNWPMLEKSLGKITILFIEIDQQILRFWQFVEPSKKLVPKFSMQYVYL